MAIGNLPCRLPCRKASVPPLQGTLGSALQELGELMLVALQRVFHLRQVVPTIIDARDRGKRRRVAKQSFDDVRRSDLPLGALRRKRPAQIVQRPSSHATELIELAFVEPERRQ